MKKKLTLVLTALLAVVLIASAAFAVSATEDIASGTVGENITWVIDADGVLTISGQGVLDVEWYAPPWEDHCDDVKAAVVEEGITGLEDTVFAYCKNMVSLSLPASVASIDSYMLWENYSLETIEIAEANENYVSEDNVIFTKDKKTLMFYACNKQGTEYTVPSSVETIGVYAFHNVQNLENIIIPDTVTEIGGSAFAVSSIKNVVLGNGITVLPNYLFQDSVIESIVIPDSVKTINPCAFYNCNKLRTVFLGSGIESIGRYAFRYAENLHIIHYKGTDWADVTVDPENEYLNAMSVHCITEADLKDATEADCEHSAHTKGYYCSECEMFLSGENVGEPLGHAWVDGKCSRCNEECTHIHYDKTGDCSICGKNTGLPVLELGKLTEVYVPNEEKFVYFKFVPEYKGKYVFESFASDEYDPFVEIVDSEEGYVCSDDDTIRRNFRVAASLDAGEAYYVKVSAYDDFSTFDISVDKYIEIKNHPTSDRAVVDLSWDVEAKYYWKNVTLNEITLTDQNAEKVTAREDGEPSSYNTETGWTPSEGYYGDFYFCEKEFTRGDVVIVTVYGRDAWVFLESPDDGYKEEYAYDGEAVSLVVPSDGKYVIGTSDNVTAKIEVKDYTYTTIEGENKNYFENGTIGNLYACDVEVGGESLLSKVFEYDYWINHQPTQNEPYVTVAGGGDNTYQWYSVRKGIVEITDDVAGVAYNADGEKSKYTAGKGWSGVSVSGDEHDVFAIYLKEGESITVEVNGQFYDGVGLWDYDKDEGVWEDKTDATTYVLTAEWDGEYVFYTYFIPGSDTTVKAYMQGYIRNFITGESGSTLISKEFGSYLCTVITPNGKLLVSDVVTLSPEWKTDANGKYLLDANGGKIKNAWIPDGEDWYYVDENGYLVTNNWKLDSVGWCYLGADGKMVTNEWIKDSVGWCYVGDSGYCVTDKWVEDSVGWCYLDSEGRMATGTKWIEHNGSWYYIENDYRVSMDWKQDSKGWVFLGRDGRMLTNEVAPDSVGICYVGADGYCVTSSWIYYHDLFWIYADANGRLVNNQWVKDSNGWCYIGEDYAMLTEEWVPDSVGLCYVGKAGYCVINDWVLYGEDWYHTDSEGRMMTNCWMQDSVGWCYLGADGKMIRNDWAKDSVGWCYLDENGYWDGLYSEARPE